jgi:hypothetical protein
MENKPSRRVPVEKAATQDEIKTAIQSLSEADNVRLQKFARFRIRGLSRASKGRDWQDLIGQALTDTLDPNHRCWNKSVTFVHHMLGAMRSISTAWKDAFDPDEASLESDLVRNGEDLRVASILDDISSTNPDDERVMLARQEIEEIEKHFVRNSIELDVISGWRAQMTGPEIKEALGISQTDYETAVRQIRRTADKHRQKSERIIQQL